MDNAQLRMIMEKLMSQDKGPFGIFGKTLGGMKAIETATTEALKRRARDNLMNEESVMRERLEATPGWDKLSADQRVQALLSRSTDKAGRIRKRLAEMEQGGRKVMGTLDPNVQLGIGKGDMLKGADQLQIPGFKDRVKELITGKRGGWDLGVLVDRFMR